MDAEEDIQNDVFKSIEKMWLASKFKKPKVLMAFHQSRWYIVLDDSKSVFRFLGKAAKMSIFMAVDFKCHKIKYKNTNNFIYTIAERDALQIVSTKPMDSAKSLDQFGIDKLTPLYWNTAAPAKSPRKTQVESSSESEEEEEFSDSASESSDDGKKKKKK